MALGGKIKALYFPKRNCDGSLKIIIGRFTFQSIMSMQAQIYKKTTHFS